MIRTMGLPWEAVVAKWLERRPSVYQFSRSSNVCVAKKVAYHKVCGIGKYKDTDSTSKVFPHSVVPMMFMISG